MAHTFTNLIAHVIFSTKDRVPCIDAALKRELFPYMCTIISEHGGKVLHVNGPNDHVHLLISQPATLATSDMLRLIKANSSKWAREKWPNRSKFGWQTGYGAFSVSQSNVKEVGRYIASQEEHHKKISFKQEFIAFLKKHGIEYDERYIWE
jgi:REP element-mobilizing transposase RayT